MAAGDISIDNGFPRVSGNMRVLAGTLEVDDTPRTFAIGSTGIQILDCQVQDNDGVGSASVTINANAAGTATNGSLRVYGAHQSVETYRFFLHFV
ncbi:MAG: hypothetical protein WC786_06465 [Patescibacteria group bacterium]|jgi:hypothetical protein